MPQTIESVRAEIYELARILRGCGDREGARRIISALLCGNCSEAEQDDAAISNVVRLFEQKEQPE
jgi:hypothetical protein